MKAPTFDNRFLRELPGEIERDNHPRQVTGAAWSAVAPTPVAAPRLIAHSKEVAATLGFDEQDAGASWFAEVFAGNALLPGMQTYATRYGGHQFGHWAGQLGDGRAILLGELAGPTGEHWELQLKGAGPTPYSRHADGRAVLRSSLREFLCSEAMHHLGVPTTRALSLVATGEHVMRDILYDGHPRPEPGAVVCRAAPTFIRFGHFEILASCGEKELLSRLVDFTIAYHFPHLAGTSEERRIAWFAEVCERTARLMVEWLRVGFVHGVMNTDNMSILGLTVDYGPYGWMEDFDFGWTPNITDAQGKRYCFGRQPAIARWNLECLAMALVEAMPNQAGLTEGIRRYDAVFSESAPRMWSEKFGLFDPEVEDLALIESAFPLLQSAEIDMTLFFRGLAELNMTDPQLETIHCAFYQESEFLAQGEAFQQWMGRYAARARQKSDPARKKRMNAVNPKFVPRNYLAQQAIEASERGNDDAVHELLDVLRRPYDEQPARSGFAAKRPDWARHKTGCSMLSCSS